MAAAAAGVASVGVWFADPTTPGGVLPVCPSKALFGIICPGCGGTRMVYSLMHGDLPAAVQYNAVALVGIVLAVGAWALWVRSRWRGTPMPSLRHGKLVWATVIVVLASWWVIRNIPVEPFTALRV